ncbi:Predicted arabinose efflux permease, MFS family [Collimonas sp. OK307]|nr:Predicted arabinose efflux permease, MFS family [Collimonas sp. OK307]
MKQLSTSRNTLADSLNLLATRRFGTFWIASLLSNIGTWAQQVAQPWLLLSLGASPFLIGLDAFALGAPIWLLTLVGGALADHADRRRVITLFQSIQMLCPILLVILLLTAAIQPWMVIVLSLIVGVTDALSMPSFQSIVPSLVKHEQIAQGLALNSTQFNLSRILGPAIAGILMVSVGAVGCFAVNAVSYLPFIAVALWILPHTKMPVAATNKSGSNTLFSGVGNIISDPLLRGALLTVLTSSFLCGPLIVFCPVLVKDALHGDARQFSIALGAFGVGGLLGAIALLSVGTGHDLRRLSSWFAAGYGAILVCAALNQWYWLLPILLVLAGLSMNASNISANSLLQASASPLLRGQSVSLYMLAMRGGLSVGSLLTGLSVHLMGVRYALALNGALALVAHIAIGRKWLISALPGSSPPVAGKPS